MTPVFCQTGAYGSVPAFPSFPPKPDDREQFGALLETSRWSPANSQQHQKAISTVGSGTEDALLWHAESRPSLRHAGMGQLVPSSAVLSQRGGIQELLEPGTAFFFPTGFGASPKRDVIPSPIPTCSFSVHHLAMSLALIFGVLMKPRLFRTTCHRHTQDTAQPGKMSHRSRDSAGRGPVLPILGFVRLW